MNYNFRRIFNENSNNDNFFAVVIRKNEELCISEEKNIAG